MLSHFVRKELKKEIEKAKDSVETYQFKSNLERLEARLSIYLLEKAFVTKEERDIKSCLEKRADRIFQKNVHYLHDFNHPVNKFYTQVAKIISDVFHEPYLSILIPKLATVSAEAYITSSYTHSDLCLEECILNDAGDRIINILDVYNFAVDDGVFKANSLKNRKPIYLEQSEIERMYSRHPMIQEAFDTAQDLVHFKRYGVTAGAAIKRLIDGLMEGSRERTGDEYEAGDAAYAAIVNFFEFYDQLSPEKQQIISEAKNMGEYDMHSTIRHWHTMSSNLTYLKSQVIVVDQLMLDERFGPLEEERSEEESVDTESGLSYANLPVVHQHNDILDTEYCVKLISGHMQNILDDNPMLYELMPNDEEMVVNLTLLTTASKEAEKNMIEAISTITEHRCFGKDKDQALFVELIKDILPEIKAFSLDFLDIGAIIHHYHQLQQGFPSQETLDETKYILQCIEEQYDLDSLESVFALISAEERVCFLRAIRDPMPRLSTLRGNMFFASPSTALFTDYASAAKRPRLD